MDKASEATHMEMLRRSFVAFHYKIGALITLVEGYNLGFVYIAAV
jgi:hypothetical protein